MKKGYTSINRIRSKISKFAISSAIVTLCFAALHLLDVYPKYNQFFLVVVLVSVSLAVVAALLLYLYPEKEWNHDGV